MKDTSHKKQPLNVFYSYAHEDEEHRARLSKYLASLRREGLIKEWFDANIPAGDEFEQAINKNIYIADIIVLVISMDFINSDYCWENELPEALKLHREEKAKVIPVIIRPISIDISATPFGKLKVLPKDGKPITKWTSRESGWIDVAKSIGEVAGQLFNGKKQTRSKPAAEETEAKQAPSEPKPKQPVLNKARQPKDKINRIIYNAQHKEKPTFKIIRKEGDAPVADAVANTVYDNLGKVYDFFFNIYGRNSVDNKGLPLTAVIHYGKNYENIFWDGRRIVIGDGGEYFKEFHDLDFITTDFTYAINQYESQLEYWGQSGSLITASGHIFGSLVKQYYNNQTVQEASWLIGENTLTKKGIARGIYSLSDPGTAFFEHPVLGSDTRKAHVRDMEIPKEISAVNDNGNIHENCGIPGRAFYLAASMIEGYAWEKAGKVWYEAFLSKDLSKAPTFLEFARITVDAANRLYTKDSLPSLAFRRAWELVGIDVLKKVKSKK
jgi:hypothetical protein